MAHDDMKHIPNRIFDWLQGRDFDALTQAEQAEVEAFFKPGEYQELRDVIKEINSSGDQNFSRRNTIRQNLLGRFDEKHPGNLKVQIWQARIPLWKAAASVLVLAAATMLYEMQLSGNERHAGLTQKVDSVLVVHKIPAKAEALHDTVVVYRNRYISRRADHNLPGQKTAEPQENKTENPAHAPLPATELNTQTVRELHNEPNITKGNSLKDDSAMLKRFSFVRL